MKLLLCYPEFLLFGEGAGDALGPREDDGVTGAISLSIPVVYFGTQQHSLYVSIVCSSCTVVARSLCDC